MKLKQTLLNLLASSSLIATTSFTSAPQGDGYYYVYTSANMQLTKTGESQSVCFIGEIFRKESEASAQSLRIRLQNDILILYPDISPLPTQIAAPIKYATYDEADEARGKTAANFTGGDSKIIWIKRP